MFSPTTRTHCLLALSLLAGTLLLASCGGGDSDTVTPPTPSPEPPIAEALPATPTGWLRLTPRDTVINGVKVHPTCSRAPGSDPTYHFYARRGSGAGVMVFFGGGGACWDSESCARPTNGSQAQLDPKLFFAEIGDDDPARYGGVLNASDAANPVRDWSMVYVPSCNGDLHTGSKTMQYTHPVTGQPFHIEHRGADNVRVVTEWMKANFSAPDQLLLLGSSAGGVGAITHYPGMQRAFPRARTDLLIESGPTLMPAVFESTYRHNWNMQIDPSVWGPQASSTAVADLLKPLATAYPQYRFAQAISAADMTLISYYGRMSHGVQTPITADTCSAWVDGMSAQLLSNQSASNLRTYKLAGTQHSLLGWPFTDATAPVARWMGEMLSPQPPEQSGWSNITCTDCDQTAYCPAP